VYALKSADELRQRMRSGVTASSGIELAAPVRYSNGAHQAAC
jgi:hypothetical protein